MIFFIFLKEMSLILILYRILNEWYIVGQDWFLVYFSNNTDIISARIVLKSFEGYIFKPTSNYKLHF